MKRKTLALILTVAMVILMIPVTASAASETLSLSVQSTEVNLQEGATVTVPIVATENTGYCSGVIDLTWDADALVLESIDYNSSLSPEYNPAPITNDGFYKINFGDEAASENYVGTGTFFTLSFTIAADAKSGKYDIVISNADVMNTDIESVTTNLSSGAVTLKGEESCDHSNMTFVPAQDAKCTEDGNNAYYYCPDCKTYFKDSEGKTVTTVDAETIPAKGHTPGEAVKENEVAAGCETKGSYDEVVYCTVCEKEISRDAKEIPATGHEWGEWKVNKEATETEEGSKTHTCKNDPTHTETVPIPVIPHVHDLEVVEGKPATCTEEGIKTYYKCKKDNCGKMFEDATASVEIVDAKELVIAKLPHTPSEWIIDKEATEEESGHRHKICTECKTTIVDEDYELKKAIAFTVDAVPSKIFAKPILEEWVFDNDGFKDIDTQKAGISYEELCADYLINKNMVGAKITVSFNDGTKETYTISRNCSLQGWALMGNYMLDESLDLWMSVVDLCNFKAEVTVDGVEGAVQFTANSATSPVDPTKPTGGEDNTKPTDDNEKVEPSTTKPAASGDSATSDGGATSGTSNGFVQTGDSNFAVVVFAVMVALAGVSFVVYFIKRRKASK